MSVSPSTSSRLSTLYIDRKNSRLKNEAGALVLYIDNQRQRSIPLRLIGRVVISARTQLESSVLLKLAEANISLAIVNPRNSQQQALLHGGLPQNVHLRLKQYRLAQNTRDARAIASDIVKLKLLRHQRFYQRLGRLRPDLRHSIQKTAWRLERALAGLKTEMYSIDSLRGIEGSAARAVMLTYQKLFADSLGFKGRNRRPPRDPVNACLSLTFTLTYQRISQAIHAVGLDPMLGFLHQPKYSHNALASDILEIWRPILEAWVWQLFRDRILTKDHFSTTNQGCLLSKTGRQHFYPAYEKRIRTLSRAIQQQLRLAIRHYEK